MSKNTHNPRWRHVYVEIQDGRYFCKIVLVDTFNLICYLPCFLSVITKRDNFRTRSSDDEGTLTKRHFSQLLPGHQTATLVIMFTKWPLMKDLKRNFAYTPRTQNPPQALDYLQCSKTGINTSDDFSWCVSKADQVLCP